MSSPKYILWASLLDKQPLLVDQGKGNRARVELSQTTYFRARTLSAPFPSKSLYKLGSVETGACLAQLLEAWSCRLFDGSEKTRVAPG
jgi:hypothetical protein